MECPARMIGEPFEDVGLFVGGIVVDDGVDDFSGLAIGALDGVEEANDPGGDAVSHAASDHGSVEDVKRGEQSGRAVALVVMGHRPAFSGLERQARLRGRAPGFGSSSIETTTVLGRVHVEADDVLDLLGELRIVGALEGANAAAAADAPRQRCTARRPTPTALAMARPVQCGVAGRFGAGQVHNLGDDLGRKRSAARLARPVAQQAFDTLLGVSRLPAPDRGSADARAPRHFLHGQAVGRTKDNARPLHMFKWTRLRSATMASRRSRSWAEEGQTV